MLGSKSKLGVRTDVSNSRKEEEPFKRIFSNMFEMVGRRLIGLYDAGFSGGLFGSRSNIMIECFQELGKYGCLNKALNKWDKYIMTLFGRVFTMKLVIRFVDRNLFNDNFSFNNKNVLVVGLLCDLPILYINTLQIFIL